jgi:NAD(P)-dependent dehydrogenase (short-subunit alcohol dehydrogenase family)
MPRLQDQVAIVTGAAHGIGAGTARRLTEEGARVLVVDLDGAGAEAAAAAIREAGGAAEASTVDVRQHAAVRGMVDAVLDRWGRLDILVNNAFPGEMLGDAVSVDEAAWDTGMDVMVKAMYLAAKYSVPAMRRGGGGSIVNISSVHGLLVAPEFLVYETAKAAVLGLTRQLAVQYGPDGIRANAICPGHILVERVEAQWAANPSGLRFFEEQYPVRRVGRPRDVANAIVFLCSDEASFITGQTLAVDGGLTIQLQENLGVHLGRYVRSAPETWFPY